MGNESNQPSYFVDITSGSAISIGKGSNIQVVRYEPVILPRDDDGAELQSAYRQLREKIERYFDIVAETLGDNSQLQEETLKMLQCAKELLHEKPPEAGTLSRAQFDVRRVHVAIAKEQQIQRGENRLRWIVPVLVIVYVVAIVTVIAFGGTASQSEIPVIGIPLPIIVWSAIGSVSAILFRFYTHQPGRISDEIRWLVARPIIGIVMGALSYIAILSGLIIFGTATGTNLNADNARPQLLWVVAFLGGFSDKFFETIIDAVVGKLSNQKETLK